MIQFAFQNINVISLCEGLDVMPETETIGAFQVGVAALAETNIYWNQSNRDKVKHQLYIHLGDTRAVHPSNVSKQGKDRY